MNTNKIASNCRVISFSNGWRFLESYNTIVGVENPHGARRRSDQQFSSTTSKQLTVHWTANEAARKIPHAELQAQYAKAMIEEFKNM